MTETAVTAEWQCARCGTTNRKLVRTATIETTDRCASCHSRHVLHVGERPVRWSARLA